MLPKAAAARQREVVEREWGTSLIRSWNDHGWIDAPQRIGAKIARLIGAKPSEVTVADSVTVNLFKLITAAAALSPDRHVLLSEAGNFHTDLHVASGAVEAVPNMRLESSRATRSRRRSGRRRTSSSSPTSITRAARASTWRVTAQAKEAGARRSGTSATARARCRSTSIATGAELAVGCGYKYLNGGPGARLPLRRRASAGAARPAASRLDGPCRPFAFTDDYVPRPAISRFLAGTPPMLSLPRWNGRPVVRRRDMDASGRSRRLFDLFARSSRERCAGHGLECISPLEPDKARQPHLLSPRTCLRNLPGADRGRRDRRFPRPRRVRFGITPLYLGYEDMWIAVDAWPRILESGSWRDPRSPSAAR
jgi:kynureninase